MSVSFRLAEIEALVNAGSESRSDADELARALKAAGYGDSLVELVTPLLARFDGATLFEQGLRLHPFHGLVERGLPSLVDWNDERGWKRYAPEKTATTFYFLSNSFGELIGIPLTEDRNVARDRIAILFPDKRVYREGGLSWSDFFGAVAARPDLAGFFAKAPQHAWACQQLGCVPEPWRCFSYAVPPALGGKEAASNLLVVSLTVHVSFSLQLLKQHQEGTLAPGGQVAFVDLYDPEGRPLSPP
jgi:hypothetical protein